VSVTPADLIAAHPWRRVAFTTYALSLSFFEAVILDAIVRAGGGAQALILADVHGVRESLSEQGAHRVGKDYEVEPVAVGGGVFHPKVSVLLSPEECHVLVGSGNLTFNGWGGNCEVLEHLHPAFAADAIADTAGLFERIASSDRLRHGAAAHCAAIAGDLRRAAQGRPPNADIRLLHNLDLPIGDQVAALAAELGGAQRLVAAAPFWDGGGALDELCRNLGLGEVLVHAHAKGTVEGQAGLNWPRHARTSIKPVRLAVMDGPDEIKRPLHAKAYEVLCRQGRLLVSGSANGTAAALGPGGNVEACVVRIQRAHTTGWGYVAAEPPEPQAPLETDDEAEEKRAGVLRAVLDADDVTGQVLTPKMSGAVSVYHLAAAGPELLGTTSVAPGGSFRFTAPELEKWSWRGGRLVIRLVDGQGRRAEGFVSVASFGEIARRAGMVARRLLAFIGGNETPEDVAAILNWFHEDPQRLASDPGSIRGGGDAEKKSEDEVLVPVAALAGDYSDAFAATRGHEGGTHKAWSRFLDQILLAFREPRGPFGGTDAGTPGEDEEDNGSNDQRDPKQKDPGLDKAFASFERLFEVLTKDGSPARNGIIAFELTGYVCDRLRPDAFRVQGWLDRIVRALLAAGVAPDKRDDTAAAILTLYGFTPTPGLCRWARASLLRLGCDLAGPAPATEAVRGYQNVLLQQQGFEQLWKQVRGVRTYEEQIRGYVQALNSGKPTPDDYPDLPTEAREEWSVLEAALASPDERKKLLFAKRPDTCPVHNMKLPQAELHKLRSVGIATAKSCCNKVIIWQGA
jgi:hypothetical protein